MNKQQLAQHLHKVFANTHIQEYLLRYPDDHIFRMSLEIETAKFVDWLEALPEIPQHEDE